MITTFFLLLDAVHPIPTVNCIPLAPQYRVEYEVRRVAGASPDTTVESIQFTVGITGTGDARTAIIQDLVIDPAMARVLGGSLSPGRNRFRLACVPAESPGAKARAAIAEGDPANGAEWLLEELLGELLIQPPGPFGTFGDSASATVGISEPNRTGTRTAMWRRTAEREYVLEVRESVESSLQLPNQAPRLTLETSATSTTIALSLAGQVSRMTVISDRRYQYESGRETRTQSALRIEAAPGSGS